MDKSFIVESAKGVGTQSLTYGNQTLGQNVIEVNRESASWR